MTSIPSAGNPFLEDWEWLTSKQVSDWLAEISLGPGGLLTLSRKLRKQGLSALRTKLVLDQLTLRPLGRRKFRQADRMYFVRQLLEQATDERLAAYKTQRFAPGCAVFDICCGLGGDLMAFARQHQVTGVDLDPRACLIASKNCQVHGLQADFLVEPAEKVLIEPGAWVHVDPDRRATGQRSTVADSFSPNTSWIAQLLVQNPNAAVKLAPATRLPDTWPPCERQWLGDRRECKQQIAWFGETSRAAGQRSAAAIDRQGRVLFEWTEPAADTSAVGRVGLANAMGSFLYEPHPTLIAGRMVDSLACQLNLERFAVDVPYLTGPAMQHATLTRFEILETCRLEQRAVAQALQNHQCGTLEIKKRGVEESLIGGFSRIKLKGQHPLVLVLTRLTNRYLAIICRRQDSK